MTKMFKDVIVVGTIERPGVGRSWGGRQPRSENTVVSAYGLYPTFRNNHYPYVRLLVRCSPEIREDCIGQRGKEDV